MTVRISRKVLRIHNIKPGEVFIGDTWVRCDDPNPSLYDYFYPGVGVVKRSTLSRKVWGYNATAVSVSEHSLLSRWKDGSVEGRIEEVQHIDLSEHIGVIVFTKSERRVLVSKEFYFDAALQPFQQLSVIYDNDQAVGAIALASDRITRLVKE